MDKEILELKKDYLIGGGYIPFDKSWLIRMGMLDLFMLKNCINMLTFLRGNKRVLSFDLLALLNVLENWDIKEDIYVMESGTLFRFLQFAIWKFHIKKTLIKGGSLITRPMTDDRRIIFYSQESLSKLDFKTNQWASAAALFGDKERIIGASPKLKLTYDAIYYYISHGMSWNVRYDDTIVTQLVMFLDMLVHHGELTFRLGPFKNYSSEYYPFFRIFGFIGPREGENIWPSLRGHETDRIEETEKAVAAIRNGSRIISDDHRIVYAAEIYAIIMGIKLEIVVPSAVNKSWRREQFERFFNDIPKLDKVWRNNWS